MEFSELNRACAILGRFPYNGNDNTSVFSIFLVVLSFLGYSSTGLYHETYLIWVHHRWMLYRDCECILHVSHRREALVRLLISAEFDLVCSRAFATGSPVAYH